MNHRVCVAFGTRPEASKMGPVVRELYKHPNLDPIVLVTGQHREQLDSMLRMFEIPVDVDLGVMSERQSLSDLVGRIVPAVGRALRELSPEYVPLGTNFALTRSCLCAGPAPPSFATDSKYLRDQDMNINISPTK